MLRTILRGWAVTAVAAVSMSASADQVKTMPIDVSQLLLSGDGRAGWGISWGPGVDHILSYVWTPEKRYQPLGRDPWSASGISPAAGISGDGKTIAQTIVSDSGTYPTAGVWTDAGGWRQLSDIESHAYGISRDGKVVVGEMFVAGANAWHGFMWSAATGMVDVGSGGLHSVVRAASADGSVLVGYDFDPTYFQPRPAAWIHGVLTLLDGDDAAGTANAVNADGTIIVGTSHDRPVMWTWQDGALVRTLLRSRDAATPIYKAQPLALSDDGRIVAGYGYNTSGPLPTYGFVWTASTGTIQADEYFEAFGYHGHTTIQEVYSMTPDGRKMAVRGGCNDACVISRVPAASAAGAP